jgi:tetratricopeptide (TPR) repeat protein
MIGRLRTWLARQDRVNRSAITVVALGLIAFGGYRVWQYTSGERRTTGARAALDRRDYKTARTLLDREMEARPDSGEVAFLAARAARLDGDLRAADRLLTRSTELGWAENAVTFERVLLRAQAGEFRAVEPALVAYLREDPPPPDADLVLDVVVPAYLREYDLGLALEVLETWTARRPNDVRLRLWQYEAAKRMKARTLATDALKAAHAAAPDDPEVRLKLGEQLLELNRADEARPHFDWLLARNPERLAYRFGLARCQRLLGDFPAAIRTLDELLAIDPENAQYLAHRGYAEFFAGRPREALPWLRRAEARTPFEHDLLANLALCLEQAGQSEEAKQVRDRAAKVEADLLELEAVTKAVKDNPADPEPRYRAGVIFARNGQPAEAQRWLASALRVNPDHVPSQQALGELMNPRREPPRPR